MRDVMLWRADLLAAVLTASLAAPLATAAMAHAHLMTSSPSAGSELQSPPADLVLNFTEPLEPAYVRIELTVGGKPVPQAGAFELGATHKSVRMKLPVLAAGLYDVAWQVVSTDGHRTEGRFKFRVGPL